MSAMPAAMLQPGNQGKENGVGQSEAALVTILMS